MRTLFDTSDFTGSADLQEAQASDDELLRQSLPRVVSLLAEGVTTLEIKSGYGLSRAAETKMLRIARRVGQVLPVTVKTMLLPLAQPERFTSSCTMVFSSGEL